jgi:hypothetical protein
MKYKITDYIKDFLNDPNNFKNIKNRSEADFQFELGYFLKAIKKINNIRFEYQFKDLYFKNKQILKKEADICILKENNETVDVCIEIKLLKKNSGSTNFFANCFEDICYLLQLKNEKEISRGYFVLICSDTTIIQSTRDSIGCEFWKGFELDDMGNSLLKELSEYTEDDLPNINSYKHTKLRDFIKSEYVSVGLAEKKIKYSLIPVKNSKYAYCLVEI